MKKGLISIIVPIYNVDKYLNKCVRSILNQTYTNIEVILVDDGSTDQSGYVCDTFAEFDNRVRVVHQNNSGLTVTRRVGVNLAKGDYIGFVDGDDWIEPDMYEVLYHYAVNNEADIVTSAGIREGGSKQGNILCDSISKGLYRVNEEEGYIIRHIFSASWSSEKNLNGAVWNKLFKREIIKKTLDNMDDNVNGFMDDNVCVVGSILYASKIYVSQDVLYHHRERKDAFTNSKNPYALMQINYAYLSLRKFVEESPYKSILYPLLVEHTLVKLMGACNVFFDEPKVRLPNYFLKCDKIPLRSKIIIYGAGAVGKSYIQQIQAENKYIITAVVDKNASGVEGKIEICRPNNIVNYSYDYIIIAVIDYMNAENIKKELIDMNVSEDKIFWQKPIPLAEYYNIHDNSILEEK